MDETTPAPVGFADLGLSPSLLEVVTALGYEEPTPIQREAIPVMLTGRDVLGQAATGTGKTAAFALPLLERLTVTDVPNKPSVLVLVPTRELAMQVAEAFHRYGRARGARVLPIYGGQPIGRQIRSLSSPVDVVVATPGRALDHLGRGTMSFENVKAIVLDEADEMLDMGFADELEQVLSAAPTERQTVLFSATMPRRIQDVASKHLKDPQLIAIARERVAVGETPKVRQVAYIVPRSYKIAALGRVLDHETPGATLVFCRTRNDVDEVTEALNGRGYRAEALHGGMSQELRDKVMRRLRGGAAELLVATDVAARGLDVDVLTHVINFEVPSSPEVYVHRIGRVGRAGREGVAVTLIEPREHRLLKNIERLTRVRIDVARMPTVADLRARRLELTRASLREVLLGGDLDSFRSVVEGLSDEFDVMDVALAAVKLAHEAGLSDEDDESEIPDLSVRAPREPRRFEDRRDDRSYDRRDDRSYDRRDDRSYDRRDDRSHDRRDERPAERRDDRPVERRDDRPVERRDERPVERRDEEPAERREAPAERREAPSARREAPEGRPERRREDRAARREDRQDYPREPREGGEAPRGPRPPTAGMARIWVGAGRDLGIRPRDLVGAITHEAGVAGRAVGSVQIAERFSIVEVDDSVADDVIDALRGTSLRGRKVRVRRDRWE